MLLIVSGWFYHHPSHLSDTQYCIRVDDNPCRISLIAADVLSRFLRNRQMKLTGMVGVPVVAVLELIGAMRRDNGPPMWLRTDIRGLYPDLSSALDGYREIGGQAYVEPGELDWRPEVSIPEDYYAL